MSTPPSASGMARNAVFLISPGAGSGRAEGRLIKLLYQNRSYLGGYQLELVRSVEEATDVLMGLAPEQVPVAVGGDGTVGMIASALWVGGFSSVPLAIVPLGTANVLANALGILSPSHGLRALKEGKVAEVDVIRTSHPKTPIAVASISAGFEGRFLGVYARTRRWGRLLAAFAGSPHLIRERDQINLELDGESVIEPGAIPFGAGLYNTPGYAPGIAMSPQADVHDGIAESIVFENARTYLRALCDGARGRVAPERSGAARRPWRKAILESTGPLQIDGETLPPGELTALVVRGGLRVSTPRS